MPHLDDVDVRLLLALLEEPRAQVGELANLVGVARNTIQSRMGKLERSGALRQGGRDIDLSLLGFDVLAFITIEVNHRELDNVLTALRTLEQVLEVHEISGRGDIWCRLAARDTHHLQSGLRKVLRLPGVIRTETSLALGEHIPYRVRPLLEHVLGARTR